MVISVVCFILSCKLSMGVSSMLVLKRISKAFNIRQGQHNNRSPPDVGFLFLVLQCKCKVFIIVEFV